MSEIWDKGLGHVNTPAFPFLVILLKEQKVYFVFTQLRRKQAWNSNRKSNQLFVFHSDIPLRPSCNMDRLASVAVSPVFALSYSHTSASVFQGLDLELLFFSSSSFSPQMVLPITTALGIDMINRLTGLNLYLSPHFSQNPIITAKNSLWFVFPQTCPPLSNSCCPSPYSKSRSFPNKTSFLSHLPVSLLLTSLIF